MLIRRFASVAFALCLGAPALAAEVAGVTLADSVSVGGQVLVLNGAGTRVKLFFRIYVGSLYLPQKVGDLAGVLARGPRRIQMNLLRDLTSDQLVGALVGGLNANNSPDEMAAVKAGTDQLVRILTAFKDVDVKANDVLTMDFVDGGTRVALNGEAKGVVPGTEFNSALTRIWLGDKPAEEKLKKAMLGG
jgi:Chalcone isomerase-like